MNQLDETRPFVPLRIALLTVSDSRSVADDHSGDLLAKLVQKSGHIVARREMVRDERAQIETLLREWSKDSGIDVIISTGGTGVTGRDVTVEAHRAIYEKELDGFSTLFHQISATKIGTSTMLSRACAGVANNTYLFAVPGSPGACRDGWDEILKWQLDNRHRPCNLVEMMPRLSEGTSSK